MFYTTGQVEWQFICYMFIEKQFAPTTLGSSERIIALCWWM